MELDLIIFKEKKNLRGLLVVVVVLFLVFHSFLYLNSNDKMGRKDLF